MLFKVIAGLTVVKILGVYEERGGNIAILLSTVLNVYIKRY